MNDEKVKFFWVEAGSYQDCEHALSVSSTTASVIAFRSHEPKYAKMAGHYSLDGIRDFVANIKSSGLGNLDLPVGGIQLTNEALVKKTTFSVQKLNKGFGPLVPKGSKVKVHYTGKLLDGTVFDSSHSRGRPIEFEIGVGRVIRGWDEGITQLQKGQKAILTCPPDYAYGEKGRPGKIPPNSTLIFEVEVVDF